jgi:hypothetical protein
VAHGIVGLLIVVTAGLAGFGLYRLFDARFDDD